MSPRPLLVLALLPFLVGARKAQRVSVPDQVGPTAAPNLRYLRDSFDTDPSAYLGRFLVPGAAPDEVSAVVTRCSAFVVPKVVGAGGVEYDEVFGASAGVAAKLGLPPLLGADGGWGRESGARVTYVATEKMIATVPDAAGFEACCKAAPDQCPGPYVGEMLAGTGTLWTAVGKEGKLQAGVTVPVSGVVTGVAGELEAKGGTKWERGIRFTTPVYFAMKFTEPGFDATPVAAGCGDWIDQPPTSPDGEYFVGVSEVLASEQLAHDGAMLHARRQVVSWLGTQLVMGGDWKAEWQGRPQALDALVADQAWVEHSAAGLVNFVKDQNRCVQPDHSDPDASVTRYKEWVLAWFPRPAAERAAAEMGWVLDAPRAGGPPAGAAPGSAPVGAQAPSAPATGAPATGAPAPAPASPSTPPTTGKPPESP